MRWEHTKDGWWVVEHDGQLRTGPFPTQDKARAWFERELDKTLPAEMEVTRVL